jgi:hypothetical protein
VAKKLDETAIRYIHHHGKLSEAMTQATDSETRKTLLLAMHKLELELVIDYKLTLPNGIAVDSLYE